jgi:hypothetical protein
LLIGLDPDFSTEMKRSTKKRVETTTKSDVLTNEEEHPKNKVKIMNYRLLLNIVGLVPPTNASPFVRLLYKVIIMGILILFMFSLVGQLMAVYAHWGDIPVISVTVSYMSGLSLATISCAYFLRTKDKFLNLIDLLRMDLMPRIKAKYIGFINVAEGQVKNFLIISFTFAVICCGIWFTIPIIKHFNVKNSNATTEGHEFEDLIYVIWAPFEIFDSPQFQIIMVLQIFTSGFSASTLFAVDITFLSMMAHAAAQFKVLCAMLKDMHENISEGVSHRTEHTSPTRGSADDSPVKETLTSANDSVPHESRNENCGSLKSETVHPENSQDGADPFPLYLAECIRYHQAVIGYVTVLQTSTADTHSDKFILPFRTFKTSVIILQLVAVQGSVGQMMPRDSLKRGGDICFSTEFLEQYTLCHDPSRRLPFQFCINKQ